MLSRSTLVLVLEINCHTQHPIYLLRWYLCCHHWMRRWHAIAVTLHEHPRSPAAGGRFKKLLNLRALNFFLLIKSTSLNVLVRYFVANFKGTFEIPHKISYPYIERYDFYTALKFQELLDLRAHMRFWNAPSTQWLLGSHHKRPVIWKTSPCHEIIMQIPQWVNGHRIYVKHFSKCHESGNSCQ